MPKGSVAFQYRSTQWPLANEHRIHRIAQDGAVVDIVFFPDGHLALIVDFQGERKESHFQRIAIESGGIVKMAFSWSDCEVLADVGGDALTPLDRSNDEILEARIAGKQAYEMGHFSVDASTLKSLPREDWLFIETLADISRKVNSNSRYDLVRLSALLRQLLCDSVPLVRSVNRRYKLDIQFEVAIREPRAIPYPDELWLNARPVYPVNHDEATPVVLDRFLKMVVLTYRGVGCTVGNVIDVVANAFGGVHHGELRTREDHALDLLEGELLVQDESLILYCLRDIGKVTLRALLPLGEQIAAQGAASIRRDSSLTDPS